VLVIVGYIVILGSVFGGYALAGGHLAVLFQPLELLMIGGAALGASFVGNNAKNLKATIKTLPNVFKDPNTQKLCIWN
jgi:chemotaxis protein MotA